MRKPFFNTLPYSRLWMVTLLLLLLPPLLSAADGPLITIDHPIATDFATYTPLPVRVTPQVIPYTLDPDLGNVANLGAFQLSGEDRTLIAENGFVVTPECTNGDATGYNEIYDLYLEAAERGLPIFVTSDAVLHTWHRVFDETLQITEEERFSPTLLAMDLDLFNRAQALDQAIGQTSTGILAAYFAVAVKLLDPDWSVPDDYSNVVNAEVSLIVAHSGYQMTPLFHAYYEDYSQYKPRGHYTRNETLKRFFRAMMWHGRMTFVLRGYDGQMRLDITGAALLLTQMMCDTTLSNPWASIYRPTIFFVGDADDAMWSDYLTIARQIYGEDFATLDPETILDAAQLTAFTAAAQEQLPEPKIPSGTGIGLRFMGQRFIPDSYIFTQLTYPKVDDRYLPKGLDAMAVLGSDEAYDLLEAMGETAYPGYEENVTKLKAEFAETPQETWASNLYWNWLYCLMPLLYPKGEGYPLFMQNDAWTKKELNTALGSWTELRHDTILYAKQSTSGTGADFLFVLPSYVEPNPALYGRLASLTIYALDGLDGMDLLSQAQVDQLKTLRDLLLALKEMAKRELVNLPLTDEQNAILAQFGRTIKTIVADPRSEDPMSNYPNDDPIPVIADVHTDPNSSTCLEEGVGFPMTIYVAVPQGDRIFLTVGAVFSYYEFIQPISNRLTDEEWRTILTGEDPPSPPEWTMSFMDSVTTSNPRPASAYLDKLFREVAVTWEIQEGNLIVHVALPPEDLATEASFNDAALTPAIEAEGDGARVTLPLPPDAHGLVELWLTGYDGLYQSLYRIPVHLDGHARPF